MPFDFDEEVWSQLVERFARLGRTPAPSNRSQAEVPRGAAGAAESVGHGARPLVRGDTRSRHHAARRARRDAEADGARGGAEAGRPEPRRRDSLVRGPRPRPARWIPRSAPDERRCLRQGRVSSQATSDAAVASLCLGARRPPRSAEKSLRSSQLGHYANVVRLDDRTWHRPEHRRRRDQGGRCGAARALGHGGDRPRGDERQRRGVRRRRAAGDGRLLAVEGADPEVAGRSAPAWRGAPSSPGSRSPGARWHSSATSSRESTLAGACIGLVALDAIVDRRSDRARATPVIGLPSSGLHSNGYTLARRSCPTSRSTTSRLGRPLGESCSSRPRSTSPIVELLALSRSTSAGSPTSPATASTTCCASAPTSATRSTTRSPRRPSSSLIAELGRGRRRGDARGLQHGLRLRRDGSRAGRRSRAILRPHYPEAKRIGRADDGPAGGPAARFRRR